VSNRASDDYDIDLDLSIRGEVTFPVDLSVYNTNTIDPNASDEVSCKVTTPENEGTITITVTGSIDLAKKGLLPRIGHEVDETRSISVTTPIDEINISLPPISIEISSVPPVYIILKPTFYLNSSIVASASVEGPATISQNNLEWFSDEAIEIITVYSSSEAQQDDSITLTIKDINYNWDSWIIVGVYLEVPPFPEKHVVDSPQLIYQTNDITSDGNVAVPFNITVIPEFPSWIILPLIMIAVLAVIVLKKTMQRI